MSKYRIVCILRPFRQLSRGYCTDGTVSNTREDLPDHTSSVSNQFKAIRYQTRITKPINYILPELGIRALLVDDKVMNKDE